MGINANRRQFFIVLSFDDENNDAILCTICLRRIILLGEFLGGLGRVVYTDICLSLSFEKSILWLEFANLDFDIKYLILYFYENKYFMAI